MLHIQCQQVGDEASSNVHVSVWAYCSGNASGSERSRELVTHRPPKGMQKSVQSFNNDLLKKSLREKNWLCSFFFFLTALTNYQMSEDARYRQILKIKMTDKKIIE